MNKHAATGIQLGILVGIVALVAVGLWQVHRDDPMLLSIGRSRLDIMNTKSHLTAIVPANRRDVADRALDEGFKSLEHTENVLSAWRSNSDISQLNDAEAGLNVRLRPETVEILEISKALTDQTGGAFDVTCAPLFNLWRKARETGQLPPNDVIDEALQACGWGQYKLDPDTAMRHHVAAKMDLGGIAKGYGIDRAVEAMKAAGVVGGMVNVGGDIRCFGKNTDGRKWRITIQDPFSRKKGKPIGKVVLDQGAICTSGNYERYAAIDGKRYSHIIDPYTGKPIDGVPSVTVVAPTAVQADAWATALSVLAARPEGPEAALHMLKDTGIEATIVVGTTTDPKFYETDGFAALLDK